MSRKHVVKGYDMFTVVGAKNMNAAFTTDITNVEQLDKVSIHVKWDSAGPEGEFTLEARNSEKDQWFELAFSAAIDVLAADDEIQILLLETPFTEIRLNWIPSNAVSANVSARLSMKVVGA